MANANAKKTTNVMPKNVNTVEVRGMIVNIYNTPTFLALTVSTAPRGTQRDYPRIYCYDEVAKDIIENYNVGDHVSVQARVQTSRKYKSQSVVGVSIKETEKELKEKINVDTGRYLLDKNEAIISGTFLRAYVPEGKEGVLAIVTVRTVDEGHTNFPQIACFGKVLETVEQMKPNDNVCFIAHVQTNKQEKDGETIYHQSLVSYYAENLSSKEG